MPNWCSNTIYISHEDTDKLNEVIKALTTKRNDEGGGSMLFSYCKPEPDYTKTIVKSTYPSINGKEFVTEDSRKWWDWRIQNWGTKWDIDVLKESELTLNKNEVGFNCSTAWSPPLIALQELEDRGFKIICEYYEGGVGFLGRYSTEEGESDYDLPTTLEELRERMEEDKIFKDLVESWGIDLDYEEMEEERLGDREPQEPTRIV